MPSKFLTAEWRNLLMINYPVEPDLLTAYLPQQTEIDFWNGTTYVSLVAFSFLNTKLKRIPIPFHQHFEEINLRFYVRQKHQDEWRRGVVFIKEVVPKLAIAKVARWCYNENYVACPTELIHDLPIHDQSGTITYRWRDKREWFTLGADYVGEPSLAESGSLEEFITEHYWGYSAQRDGGTIEYQVEHPKWNVWQASNLTVDGDFGSFYGTEFEAVFQQKPSSAFIADGSETTVYAGVRV